MNQRWECTTVAADDAARVRGWLDLGWEPFAVTFEYGKRCLHLRKLFTPSPERIGLDA
jgi:hypothetical protein